MASVNEVTNLFYFECVSMWYVFSSLLTLNMKNLFGKKKLTIKRSRTMHASVKLMISAIWTVWCTVSCQAYKQCILRKTQRNVLTSKFSDYQYWAPKLKTGICGHLQNYVFWMLLKWVSGLSYSFTYFTLYFIFAEYLFVFPVFLMVVYTFWFLEDINCEINYGFW